MLAQILRHVLFGPLLLFFIIYLPLLVFLFFRSQQTINSELNGVDVVIKPSVWGWVNRVVVCSYAFMMPILLHLYWKVSFYERGIVMPFVLGVFCAISAYFIAYYFDPKTNNLQQLKLNLNLVPIGDFSDAFESKQIDAFRERILTSLNTEVKPLVILCTSFHYGEGKSLIATSLAKSFSRVYSRVLLMELDPWCDLPNRLIPASHRNSTLGISDIIYGQCSMGDVLQVPAEESITLLPRGNKVDQPYELMNSPKIIEAIQENMRSFSTIIIDAPTISNYPEVSQFLTGNGVVVLAVSHQANKRQLLKINDYMKRFSLKKRVLAILTRNQ